MKTVLKILAALAAIAGIIYVIATFGDKIVAWAKKVLPACPCKEDAAAECEACEACECAEEAPAEEAVVEEAPVEEVVIEETEPVAEDADFEA